jgi:small subunit ribosomal protein S3
MIERQFLQRKIKEYQIGEFISANLDKAGYSHTEIKRTPLGEKIIIYTSKPGLIVGREGSNIKDLAETLKKKFKLENPQVEVAEIENPNLNAKYVAKHIVHVFEKYGPKRFKSVGYKKLQDIMNSGAVGAEIVVSGRGVPSQRAKMTRFKAGYLKKSGDISLNHVDKGYAFAHLRTGTVGIQVRILHPETKLPDEIIIHPLNAPVQEQKIIIEEIKEVSVEKTDKEEKKSKQDKEKPKKKAPKKVKEELKEDNGDSKEE